MRHAQFAEANGTSVAREDNAFASGNKLTAGNSFLYILSTAVCYCRRLEDPLESLYMSFSSTCGCEF